jgi:hypothetical protein
VEAPIFINNDPVSQVATSWMALMERGFLAESRLRPITSGDLLATFSCRTILRMKRSGLAKRMVISN